MSDIICITNRALCKGDFIAHIKLIAEAHPAGIILREKDLSEDEYEILARQIMSVCEETKTPCILHSFVHVAINLGADKIHLPISRLRTLGTDIKSFSVIGASCHSVDEAKEAEALGCTYITAGHIFDTECKAGLPGRGIRFLSEICKNVSVPVYAIGGITPERITEIYRAGASGTCIMSGIMCCDDPKKIISEFKFRV